MTKKRKIISIFRWNFIPKFFFKKKIIEFSMLKIVQYSITSSEGLLATNSAVSGAELAARADSVCFVPTYSIFQTTYHYNKSWAPSFSSTFLSTRIHQLPWQHICFHYT
jgi:hypothetical protein